MKAILFVAALALAAACGKPNDATILQEEATALAKHYQPNPEKPLELDELTALDKRVEAIFKRGSTIPGNLPGIEDVGKRLQEARDTLVKLRGIVGQGPGPDKRSALEKQAEAAAKAGKVADLQKLVHDSEEELERGLTIVHDDLDAVESWIANYDRKTLAMNAPAPAGGQTGEPSQAPATPPAPEQPVNPAQPAAPAPEAPKQ